VHLSPMLSLGQQPTKALRLVLEKSLFIFWGEQSDRTKKIQPNMNILRPLSPHLPIYKPQLTSTFSISHRISGAFLATIVFFFDLLCLKIGLICFTYESVYQFFFYSSKLILFVLFFIAYLIVSIVWERYLIAEQLSLRFSIGTI
jgi:hypothetical protein